METIFENYKEMVAKDIKFWQSEANLYAPEKEPKWVNYVGECINKIWQLRKIEQFLDDNKKDLDK